MSDTTRAEICVVACAETWRGDGEIVASPIGTIPMIAVRLAASTFEPDLLYTDGDALLLAEPMPVGGPPEAPRKAEAWLPFGKFFDVVWSGKRHVMMGATQIDRFGNQNIACIGPWAKPKAMLLGVRGGPGNTLNHPTSYWVPNHSTRSFVPEVDCVSGVGWDRVPKGAERFHEIRRVVSNLAVMDFETPDHSMRLRSVHPGVTVDEVVAATGFELSVPADVPETRLPTEDELRFIREVIDPQGLRNAEVKEQILHPQLRTPLCELVGIDVPVVQTGMGWVSGPELTSATANAGGLGILAGAVMDRDELAAAIRAVKERTGNPFGVNMRADHPQIDDLLGLLIAEGVKVASFAMAPKQELIKRLKDAGVVVIPSIGAKRHAEKVAAWGVDAVLVQGGEGGGHTGSVPTTLLLPQVVDAVDIPVVAAGGFFDGRGLVAALAYGAAGIAMGTRFLLTKDCVVPDGVKAEYLKRTVTDTVVTTQVDGWPHRVLRTELVDQLEKGSAVTSLPRAVRNAFGFKKLSGTSWRAIVKEGLVMRKAQELTWSQVVMAANTPMLLRKAMVEGRPDLGVMASGQVVGLIDDLPTVAALIDRIVAEADKTLTRLGNGP